MLRFDHRAVEDIYVRFRRLVPAPLGCRWQLDHARGTDDGTVYTLHAVDVQGKPPKGCSLDTQWITSRAAYDALEAMIQAVTYLRQRAAEQEAPKGRIGVQPRLKTASTLLHPWQNDKAKTDRPSAADVKARWRESLQELRTEQSRPERQAQGHPGPQYPQRVIRRTRQQLPPQE